MKQLDSPTCVYSPGCCCCCPGPDLGGGAGLPPTGGLPPNLSIFWLMIDVSLVILIEDFEINEN